MATLVVVRDGVEIWVALRFPYHLYGIKNVRAGVRTVKKPIIKFTLAILVGDPTAPFSPPAQT